MIYFRPLPALTAWFTVVFALLLGLGSWQVYRLHWKENLIATVGARMRGVPVPLEEALSHGLASAEWRHVRVGGTFAHEREVYLFAQNADGDVGVHVITPLTQGGGNIVLVDRGFVPQDRKDAGTRAGGQTAGTVVVTGILRLPQSPGWFTPEPVAKDRMVFAKDASAVARLAGVTPAVPLFIEADLVPQNPGGLPLGGQTVVDFPNNHLQYAITWFVLAFVAAVFYVLYHRTQGRLGFR